uniref:Si:ch211-157p22.10 n=1 Tax=Oryzias melastigma TaxID=30732 RepID=A0A3B3D5R2_ORYME
MPEPADKVHLPAQTPPSAADATVVLGSGSIIVCLISQRLSRKPELQPLFLLSVADLLLAACWLVGAVFFSLRCGVLNSLCYNLHILEQVHPPMVLVTCCHGYSFLRSYSLILFMLPVFVIGNMNVCQTNSRVTSLLLQVLVAKARHFHVRAMASNGIVGPEQRAALRVLDQRVVLYPLVFVLCWGSAQIYPPSPLQALTSASQGFLNCLVYGWTSVHLRRVGLTALTRDANPQTPLLQSQKTRSYKGLRAFWTKWSGKWMDFNVTKEPQRRGQRATIEESKSHNGGVKEPQ